MTPAAPPRPPARGPARPTVVCSPRGASAPSPCRSPSSRWPWRRWRRRRRHRGPTAADANHAGDGERRADRRRTDGTVGGPGRPRPTRTAFVTESADAPRSSATTRWGVLRGSSGDRHDRHGPDHPVGRHARGVHERRDARRDRPRRSTRPTPPTSPRPCPRAATSSRPWSAARRCRSRPTASWAEIDNDLAAEAHRVPTGRRLEPSPELTAARDAAQACAEAGPHDHAEGSRSVAPVQQPGTTTDVLH